MPAVAVMQRMALGMVVMIKRKTRFPTDVTATPKKAKPTTVAMAFCVYIILFYVLLQVTPSANRNSYRVAIPYYIYTQGRGAAPLNPGL